ncbi:MAG TPA: hypothetical protein VFW21_12405 [Mycobacterium sp.]|nr:hypothetical protein [Mycobacterium sp.]
MAKSILFVESRPVSADRVDDFNRWYQETHIPEMLTIDGFVSARRFATEGDSFIALYEIDTDVETARANVKAAYATGRMSPAELAQTDPPATQRWLSLLT